MVPDFNIILLVSENNSHWNWIWLKDQVTFNQHEWQRNDYYMSHKKLFTTGKQYNIESNSGKPSKKEIVDHKNDLIEMALRKSSRAVVSQAGPSVYII